MTLALNPTRFGMLLLSHFAACGKSDADDSGTTTDTDTDTTTDTTTHTGTASTGDTGLSVSVPQVVFTFPADLALNVGLRERVAVTFSEAMDPATLDQDSYSVGAAGGASLVLGTMLYADSTLTFWPTELLDPQTLYTATVTADAESALGVPMNEDFSWTFTTGDPPVPAQGVTLGTAADFAILAKSAISTVPASVISGDIGVSPAAATFITGFSLTADASNVFSTSTQVVGQVFAADYAAPTPAFMTAAIGDMETAFTDAAGRAPDVTELGAGDVSGLTLIPGVYKWGTGLLIASDVTLQGSATDVWIFEVAQGLTVSNGTRVVLAGGALPKNVYWQVSGLVDIGTTAHLEGVVLSQTSIELHTGASVNGRLLAQTAVVLDANVVVEPAP